MALPPTAWSSADLDAARLAKEAGRIDEARTLLARVIQHPPSDLPNRQLLARLLIECRRYRDALPVLDDTFGCFPEDPTIAQLRAECKGWLGDLDGALFDAETAVRLSDQSVESLRVLYLCQLLRKDPAGILRVVRFLTEREPDDSEHWTNRGIHACEAGLIEEATECWQRAADIAPAAWQPPYNLGILHMNREEPSEAIPLFLKAIILAEKETKPREALEQAVWQVLAPTSPLAVLSELLMGLRLNPEQERRLQRFDPRVREIFIEGRTRRRRFLRGVTVFIFVELVMLLGTLVWTYCWLAWGVTAAKLDSAWLVLYLLLAFANALVLFGWWMVFRARARQQKGC